MSPNSKCAAHKKRSSPPSSPPPIAQTKSCSPAGASSKQNRYPSGISVSLRKRSVCVDFHEIFEAPCDRLGLSDVFTERHTMARRLFRQAVPLRLAAPESGHARRLSKEEGSEVPVEKFYRMMGSGKRRPYQAPAGYRLPRGDGPLGRQGRRALLRFYDAQLCFGQ